MKLLLDSKAMKGLPKLINRCVGTMPVELRIVQKIEKHKTRMGREMRLTTQIREYEMDQVILDFGIKCERITKTDMVVNGKTYASMFFDSAENGESAEGHTRGAIAGNNYGY